MMLAADTLAQLYDLRQSKKVRYAHRFIAKPCAPFATLHTSKPTAVPTSFGHRPSDYWRPTRARCFSLQPLSVTSSCSSRGSPRSTASALPALAPQARRPLWRSVSARTQTAGRACFPSVPVTPPPHVIHICREGADSAGYGCAAADNSIAEYDLNIRHPEPELRTVRRALLCSEAGISPLAFTLAPPQPYYDLVK